MLLPLSIQAIQLQALEEKFLAVSKYHNISLFLQKFFLVQKDIFVCHMHTFSVLLLFFSPEVMINFCNVCMIFIS